MDGKQNVFRAIFRKEHSFFQYIFDEKKKKEITDYLQKNGCKPIYDECFFENIEDGYKKMINIIKMDLKLKPFNFIKDVLTNFFYGMFVLKSKSGSFANGKGTGVACLLFKKS